MKYSQLEGRTEGERVSWFKTILRNVAIDWHRRSRRGGAGPTLSLDQRFGDPSSLGCGDPPADGTSPSQKCVKAEEADLLRAAIAKLPPDQRTAVTLKYLEGLPVAEVADRMGKTNDSVANLIYRGQNAVLEELGQGLTDGEEPQEQRRAGTTPGAGARRSLRGRTRRPRDQS